MEVKNNEWFEKQSIRTYRLVKQLKKTKVVVESFRQKLKKT